MHIIISLLLARKNSPAGQLTHLLFGVFVWLGWLVVYTPVWSWSLLDGRSSTAWNYRHLRIINGHSFNFSRMNFSHSHQPLLRMRLMYRAGEKMREMVYQYRDANGW